MQWKAKSGWRRAFAFFPVMAWDTKEVIWLRLYWRQPYGEYDLVDFGRTHPDAR